MVRKYKSIIRKIENQIEGVYTLTIEPLSGRFRFAPGQFLHLSIDSDYDGVSQWPESRCFSIQTSPDSSDSLKITYSGKGAYTRLMSDTLQEGSEVWVKMPYGELFEQEHSKENTVFISGGTGITPFLSLFTDSSFAEYTSPVLYAGFRTESLNLYEDELQQAKAINPKLSLNLVYENTSGILNIEKIFNNTSKDSSFFISGPPVMIKVFRQYLIENKVADNNILTDDWE
ncbi:MAG: putative Nitric oxide dioxygenase [Bacteroidetes bacterium]|nr:putative Nitric oxide dioxygenase [Bacteroidota bacterium]